jgi:hypothetical protein
MRVVVVILVLVAAVLSAYWGARGNDFIDIDDEQYLTRNAHVQQGLTTESIKWAFTTGHMGNWHPLTWLSHMLDWQMFGSDAGKHHMMNVALHALNALLLLAAMSMLTRAFWPAAVIALLWAIHPLRVESVAWAAERKDVLCATFGLLCLIAYTWHARRPGLGRYLLLTLSLALGLLAKPMLVTWPALMLVLDVWPLRRAPGSGDLRGAGDSGLPPRHHDDDSIPQRSWSALILEKIPLATLALTSSVVTFLAQRSGGAVSNFELLSVGQRLANAVVSYARYLGDTFWPTRLALMYPYRGHWGASAVIGAVALLIAVTILCIALRRRQPWLLVGWLWFVGTMVPVIGLVQVGAQSMADRYTYIPQIGLVMALVLAAWSLPRAWRPGLMMLGVAAAVGCWGLTRQQVMFWRNSDSVYARSLAVTENNWVIHANAAQRARLKGDTANEFRHLREVELHAPRTAPPILTVLADYHLRQAHWKEAAELLEEAVRLAPDAWPAVNNLAYLRAASPEPSLRDGPRALQLAQRLCEGVGESSPEYAGYLDTLAAAQASVGQFEQALATSARALDLAIARNQRDLAPIIVEHIKRYEAGLPPK